MYSPCPSFSNLYKGSSFKTPPITHVMYIFSYSYTWICRYISTEVLFMFYQEKPVYLCSLVLLNRYIDENCTGFLSCFFTQIGKSVKSLLKLYWLLQDCWFLALLFLICLHHICRITHPHSVVYIDAFLCFFFIQCCLWHLMCDIFIYTAFTLFRLIRFPVFPISLFS